jgi:hypothetical protein
VVQKQISCAQCAQEGALPLRASSPVSGPIRQSGAIANHTFEIEFLDPGVKAFFFTFG